MNLNCKQPGSSISYGGSQASSGSRKAKNRQYHTVAHTSQIDESLFGNNNNNNNNNKGDAVSIYICSI